MAHTRKRGVRTVPDGGLSGTEKLSDATSTSQKPMLATEFGIALGNLKAQHSPALNLQDWLKGDLHVLGDNGQLKRLPPIVGLAIALAFSLVSWFAMAKLVSFLFQ